MLVKYYGTRGSLPTPGKSTLKYGGNTTCLSILASGKRLIVDAGSGLRLLGNELMKEEFGHGRGEAWFFWTHFHWDHLQGFPFFVPNYIPHNRFTHYGLAAAREILIRQQDYATFPVEFGKMPSRHVFNVLEPGKSLTVGDVAVATCAMNHPGNGLTYKFTQHGKSMVFATDVEHPASGVDPQLADLCQGAELLIYDAQYTPEEYSQGKQGWGHSTWEQAVALAKVAKVKHLHLFHHDQLHSDEFLESKILRPARRAFPRTQLAREGWHFEV